MTPFVDVEGLDGNERGQRPVSPRRLTFGSLMATEVAPRTDCRGLIPIEVVQPGDEQVFAARWPHQRDTPIIDLDKLADVPSVTSIVASTVVRARRTIPQVRELLLVAMGRLVDIDTLGCLPGLNTLCVLYWIDGFDPRRLPQGLEALRIDRTSLPDGLSSLSRLTNLRKLDLRTGYPKDSMRPLSTMTRLTHLKAENVKAAWTSMAGCTELEEVDMTPRLDSLRPFKRWTKLRKLTIRGRGLKSLDGIEQFENLESLTFHGTAFRDFSLLARLTKLREVGEGNVGWCAADAESHAQFRRILCALPALEKYSALSLHRDMADALRETYPAIEIVYQDIIEPSDIIADSNGNVTVHAPEGEMKQWSIFESLADRLDLPTNYDAEKLLKRELKAKHPDVLKRLEWDSEADNVGVYAASEADIQVVAAIANELIARKST